MRQTSPDIDIADASPATATLLSLRGTEERSAAVAPTSVGGVAHAAIRFDRAHCRHADRRHAFFTPLAAHAHDAADQIEIAIVHAHQFADAHAGAVERL